MTPHPKKSESLSSCSWKSTAPPSHFLIIRLHAIGDVSITLPYCVALRERFPKAQIDFITSTPCADLPRSLSLFNNVYAFPMSTNRWSRLFHTLAASTHIYQKDYDLVIDLQRNWVSRTLRRAARPSAWGEFNRFESKSAGERTSETFAQAGFPLEPRYAMPIVEHLLSRAKELLISHGWDTVSRLVVLNPAGLLPTRNWPLAHYAQLARLWLREEPVQFLLLGTERIERQVTLLKKELGDSVVNLAGRTTLAEAFATLQSASGVVSEDSGLMHMAWVSGIPTLALFGSSRHDWSRPLGEHSVCMHSGDLECGACMSAQCKYGDVHCLTRYTPEQVFHAARHLFYRTLKETVPA